LFRHEKTSIICFLGSNRHFWARPSRHGVLQFELVQSIVTFDGCDSRIEKRERDKRRPALLFAKRH